MEAKGRPLYTVAEDTETPVQQPAATEKPKLEAAS
jgi:hypothetical protein